MPESNRLMLEKLLQQHRLIFWYDEKAEMRGLFESLIIPGVEKMVLENNEVAFKHTVLIEKPAQALPDLSVEGKARGSRKLVLDLLLANYALHAPSALSPSSS